MCDVGCNPIEKLAEVAKTQEGLLEKQGTPWVQTVEPNSASPVVGSREEVLQVPTLMQEAIGEVSEDYDFVKDWVEHSAAVEEPAHAHDLAQISVEGTALEEHHEFSPLHFYEMIGNRLKALEAETQAVAGRKMDILQGEELIALIKKQKPCVRTLLQEY